MKRKSSQELRPVSQTPTEDGIYSLYPAFPIGGGKIHSGIRALAQHLAQFDRIMIDGYVGVFWDEIRQSLADEFKQIGISSRWFDMRDAHRAQDDIEEMVAPFLGGDDPLFGTRFTGDLQDFFDTNELERLRSETIGHPHTVVYGCGAALTNLDDAVLVYLDVPKNEIQFRSRAGTITNLGKAEPECPKKMYKRFYFVDWVVLNQAKSKLLPEIDLLVDVQRPECPSFITGANFRSALTTMSMNFFRVRPWFEPGAWGGQWIKEHIPQLPTDVPNYAWSFELIVPENGCLLESGSFLLEFSFDFLMYHGHENVLGASADVFKYEFPIRFDFLDTFGGRNLSLQCHPRTKFIKEQFGETYTQDETYYMLDCGTDAHVYLGFREDISPNQFRNDLEKSEVENCPVEIENYVNRFPARKHDLYLIPNGTVHCAGKNCMVLEISATPYIFTFKMYDWLRMDLDGNPRPLNISRAFENLRFEMRGEVVSDSLISEPSVINQQADWRLVHLPTHDLHFFDVHRYEINPGGNVSIETKDSFQVLSLVEGSTVILKTEHGMVQRFNYAETFVVPARAQSFHLINETDDELKIICAFMKEKGK